MKNPMNKFKAIGKKAAQVGHGWNATLPLMIALCALCTGCLQVPKTVIEVPTARGVVRLIAPKDADIQGLYVDFSKGVLGVESYRARMNPDVITQAGASQTAQMKETFTLLRDMGLIAGNGFTGRAPGEGLPEAQPEPRATQSDRSPEPRVIFIQVPAVTNAVATNAPLFVPTIKNPKE